MNLSNIKAKTLIAFFEGKSELKRKKKRMTVTIGHAGCCA
jgi:hypothetical protein